MFEGITPSVPESFRKELKRIDPGLDCYFSRKYSRFVITQRSNISGRKPVAIVKGYSDGSYRYPDQRDIKMLQAADTYRKGQEIKDKIRAGEEYMKTYREKEMANVEDTIKHQTKLDAQQLLKGYADTYNLGKYNSAYRRVGLKKKGEATKREGYTVYDHRKI